MRNTYKFHFVSKVAGRMFLRINFFIDTILPTFQRQINVVSILKITVQITLITRWEWKWKSEIGFSTLHNSVGAQCWNNVKSTLHNVNATIFQRCTMLFQRWYYIISTLFQCGPNVSQSYIKTNLASKKYGFAENW